MKQSYFRELLLSSACFAFTLTGSSICIGQVTTMDKEADLIGVLKSNAPAADKAIACKRLAIYGTAAAAPELAKLLPDESLSSWARIALEVIPGSQADEALRNATASLNGKLLVGTINSIGVRRDAASVDVLNAKLNDKNGDVVSAAAVALGSIGNASATESLRRSMATGSPQRSLAARSSIAEGCVLCAERAMNDGNATLAAAIYDEVRKADVSKQRIVEATRGAILARKKEGVPLLIEHLRSSDLALFQVALATARELPGREVDNALAAELSQAVPDRAALVIQAIADRNEATTLSAIVSAAASGPKEVRLSALNALGRMGDASCVAPLLSIAAESDSQLTEASMKALADLPDQSVSKDILDRLAKADGKMLSVLVSVVGQRRIEATGMLIKALGNSDRSVRAAALKSLGTTVPADKLSVLVEQVVAPGYAEDLVGAQQALKAAAVRMPDRESCAALITKALDGATVPTKSALLEILASVGGTNALQAMNAAAKSSDETLKDVSSRLLGDWMTIDSAPVLLELAKTGPADKYQTRALRGYIRIARQFAMPDPDRAAMCRKAWDASQQPAEQKLVLTILERYPNMDNLQLAIKATKVAEIKEDATKSVLAIAKKLEGKTEQVQKLLAEAGIKP